MDLDLEEKRGRGRGRERMVKETTDYYIPTLHAFSARKKAGVA
jgi:hypothetical protein